MHIRTQIRNAVKNALTGLPTTGNNVFSNLVQALESEELPAIVVSTESESFSYEHPSYPRIQTRNLELNVMATVRITDTYEDAIDQIILEIENAMGDPANRTFGGLVQWHEIRDIQVDFNEEFEEPIAEVKITFEFKYRTKENDNAVNV